MTGGVPGGITEPATGDLARHPVVDPGPVGVEWPFFLASVQYYRMLAEGDDSQEAARRRDEQRARMAAAQRQWEVAHATGLHLLRQMLTARQREQMDDRGYFDLVSSRGHHWRILCRSPAGNVYLLDEAGATPVASFCAHPQGVSDPEAWLTQKLTLQLDEPGFLAVANGGGCPRAQEILAAPGEAAGGAAVGQAAGAWLRRASIAALRCGLHPF